MGREIQNDLDRINGETRNMSHTKNLNHIDKKSFANEAPKDDLEEDHQVDNAI